jgi:hypothetical protein
MSPAPNPTWSNNGYGHNNLFLEADPEVVAPRAEQRRVRGSHLRRASRGSGLVVPVSGSSPSDTTATALPDATAFARRTTRRDELRSRTRAGARRADANARRLLAQVAAPPYAALLALATVGGLLLGLSWLGLALRDATAARRSANRRVLVVDRTVKRHRVQIAGLNVRLERALAAEARPTTTVISDGPTKRSARSARAKPRH